MRDSETLLIPCGQKAALVTPSQTDRCKTKRKYETGLLDGCYFLTNEDDFFHKKSFDMENPENEQKGWCIWTELLFRPHILKAIKEINSGQEVSIPLQGKKSQLVGKLKRA